MPLLSVSACCLFLCSCNNFFFSYLFLHMNTCYISIGSRTTDNMVLGCGSQGLCSMGTALCQHVIFLNECDLILYKTHIYRSTTYIITEADHCCVYAYAWLCNTLCCSQTEMSGVHCVTRYRNLNIQSQCDSPIEHMCILPKYDS